MMMKKRFGFLAMAGIIAAASASSLLAACGEEKFDLSYATWNLSTEAVNNVERQMIAEFEKANNVKIKIEEVSTSGNAYQDSISGLAVKNKLPDVFMLPNINFGLKNQYVLDIKDLIENDGDWAKIPTALEEAVHYKSGVYAIPFSMHMMGYYANVDLITEHNADKYLEGEFTYEKLEGLARAMNKPTEGIMGLSHEQTILEWYPSYVNENYGWFTWDGARYHLDSEEFRTGIEKTLAMRQNKLTYDSLSDEDRAAHFEGVDGYVGLWDNNRLALRWGASYEAPDMSKNVDDIKFLGVPGGRTPIVGDYVAIGKSTQNKELAFKFAKWMSFDPAGISKRIQLEKKVTNTLPMTTDPELIQAYFDKFTLVDGLQEAYEALDSGIVECVKVVPGYNLSRWKAQCGANVTITISDGSSIENPELGVLLDACWMGTERYAEYAENCNTLANKKYAEAIKQFEQYYD